VSQCVAVCRSVLQRVAVSCSALQCVAVQAVHCSVLQRDSQLTCHSTIQAGKKEGGGDAPESATQTCVYTQVCTHTGASVALTIYAKLNGTARVGRVRPRLVFAVCCRVLQGVVACCRVLQGVAGCCRVLQGVAGCCRVL